MPGAMKNITLQEASRLYESLPSPRGASILHQQSDFEFSDVSLARRRQFSSNFMIFKFSTSAMETLNAFKLFSRPMDRAEVLHALRYDIELNWKNTPA